MNGKTDVDAVLNPIMAEMDRRTYGVRWANFTTFGKRLIKISILGISFDFCRLGFKSFGYWRIYNAGTLFIPFAAITWRMPKLQR